MRGKMITGVVSKNSSGGVKKVLTYIDLQPTVRNIKFRRNSQKKKHQNKPEEMCLFKS